MYLHNMYVSYEFMAVVCIHIYKCSLLYKKVQKEIKGTASKHGKQKTGLDTS